MSNEEDARQYVPLPISKTRAEQITAIARADNVNPQTVATRALAEYIERRLIPGTLEVHHV